MEGNVPYSGIRFISVVKAAVRTVALATGMPLPERIHLIIRRRLEVKSFYGLEKKLSFFSREIRYERVSV